MVRLLCRPRSVRSDFCVNFPVRGAFERRNLSISDPKCPIVQGLVSTLTLGLRFMRQLQPRGSDSCVNFPVRGVF